jgi:ribonucleoside-diphosphate reductase alpha chain
LASERGIELTIPTGPVGGIPELDWDALRKKVRKGVRNATVMAIAPNANIGLVAGTSPGIDPRFAQMFSRNKISGKYLEVNPNLVNDLKAEGLWEKYQEEILTNHGDLQDIAGIPESLKRIYKTSFSTSAYAFIEVAARAQKWVDQAISRNMYLDVRDIDEVMNIYSTAWEKGLKTTYYLHMKPKHTAEQSTTNVNKAAAMGKKGFSALFSTVSAKTDTPAAVVVEETIKIETTEPTPSPVEVVATVAVAASPVAEVVKVSEVEAAPVQAKPVLEKRKAAFAPLSELAKVAGTAQTIETKPKPKVVVHGPVDPNDALLCEGCQ